MKKFLVRTLSVMMAVVLTFTGLPLISNQADAATTTFIAAGTATKAISVKKTAKASATTVASLSKNAIFQVTDMVNDVWFKVKTTGNIVGYVKISQTKLKINAKLNTASDLYAEAGSSLSFGTVKKDTQVTALSSSGSYTLIITSSGQSGYVLSSKLTKITAKTGKYQLTANTYLRKGTGTNTTSKGKIPEYLTLKVTSTANPVWYKVKLANGVTGYVLSTKLKKVAESTVLTPISKSMYITTSDVNLRSGPGTNYAAKGYVDINQIVTVLSKTNANWYQVKTISGVTGYITSAWLKKLTCTVATSSATATPKPTATPTVKPTATPAPAAEMYMTTAKMNVRKSASKDSELIATVPKYFVVQVTSKSNSDWYKIKISDGTVGYILSNSLKKTTDPVTPVTYALYTTTAYVNLRSGAGLSYSVKQVVPENTLLSVTSKTNAEWYKVKLSDGTIGYIFAENLTSTPYTKISSTPTPTAAPTAKPTASPTAKPTATPAPTEAPSNTFYKVSVSSGLNVRSQASTSSGIVEILSYGDIVTLIEKTNSDWYKIKTKAGNTGYVAAEYLELYTPSGNEAVEITGTLSIPQYKSYYLGSDKQSKDTSIATIKKGFVYGVKPGTTTIGNYKIIVTAPEAVRSAYCAPNYPCAGEPIALKAITDTSKTAVKFKITSSSGSTTYTSTSYTTESNAAAGGYAANSVRVWSYYDITLPSGDYTLTVTSKTDGTWSTGSYTTTIHVANHISSSAVNEDHYASDAILKQITNYEGYVPVIEEDALVANAPTVAYGIVINKGEYFYNNVTKTEAYSMMVNLVNKGSFTTKLNQYVESNNLKISQAQWDALLSFSYNVGTGWMSSSIVSSILKNTVYGDIKVSSTSPKSATTIFKTYIYRTASSSSDYLEQVSSGTVVSIVGKSASTLGSGYKDMWYKVTYNGKTGYVRAGALQVSGNSSYVHDLSYVDPQAFSQNLLDWHKAGGNCIEGLFYRRLSEAKTFLYGNYSESIGTSNYTNNTYNFTYSDSALGINWNP